MQFPDSNINIKPFDSNIKDDDLLKSLSEATETKTEAVQTEVQPEAAAETQPEQEQEAQAAEIIKTEEKNRKIYSFDEEAELYIDLFDGVQELGFSIAYKKFLLSDEEKAILKECKIKMKAAKGNKDGLTLTKYEMETLIKSEDIDEDIEALPLTEKEINRLKKPLTACLEIWGRSANPTTALTMAAFAVTVPRILPFFRKR